MIKLFSRKSLNQTKNKQRGFSLLEMMVSIAIFLIVTGAVYGLLQIGRIDRNRSSQRSDMLKNARMAVHLIGRDALNAGLGYHRRGAVIPDNFLTTRLGVPSDPDTNRDMLTSVIVGNNLFTNGLNQDTTVRTDIISFAYREMTFNGGNTITIPSVAAPGGAPQTARLTTNPTQAAASQIYDLYLIESDSSQIAVMATNIPDPDSIPANNFQIDVTSGDPLGLNQDYNGTGVNGSLLKVCTILITTDCMTYPASAKKFNWVAYKVKADGTLVRMVFGNNTTRPSDEQIQEQPLAYGVQNLQFRYILEDGTTVDNPTLGTDNAPGTSDDEPLDTNLIRQIVITLEVQSSEIDEQTRKPSVITLNATFAVRNLEYDAG